MDGTGVTDPWLRQTTLTLRNINMGISRLAHELRMKRRGSFSSSEYDSGTDGSEAGADDEHDKSNEAEEGNLIPEPRQCDYPAYREFVKGQERHVLDFVVAGNDLRSEIENWEERHSELLQSTPSNINNEKIRGPNAQQKGPANIEKSRAPNESDQGQWLYAVRINSAIIIRMFRQLAANEGITIQQDFEQQPVAFERPFSFLIHHHKKMKTWLAELREMLKSECTPLDSPLGPTNQAAGLEQVQCYVDFVDDRVIPEAIKWANMASLNQQQSRIRFSDLWYLFEPGDLLWCQPPTVAGYPSGRISSTYQSIQRVHGLRRPARESKRGGPTNLTYDPVLYHPTPPEYQEPPDCFVVCTYYIEFDGEVWGAVSRRVNIPRFDGEKEITTLPVYPLRFKAGYENTLKQAAHDGKEMIKLIEQRYGPYNGWSLMNSPIGFGVIDADGPVKKPTHIESDVLVDFSEAFNTCPAWKPSFYAAGVIPSGNTGSVGWRRSLPNIEWADTHKTAGDAEVRARGRFLDWDGVDSIRASSYWLSDTYLHAERVREPSEEDFVLIPRRFYGYSVWERKFFHLDICFIQPKDTVDAGRAFSQLQIGSNDKQLIQALVRSHFHKKSFQAKHGVELDGQDLIRGKGKGLVLLLHGVPGVGKTATAEAVAQKWQKPLFPITCGDLGITSEIVEKALNEIFRLAHLWNCVLLLDEADVFITQRVKVGDLQRNGLVSVFLRMLEYYNGILFLTTNRPGVLDEAVKSRVHLTLKYDHLTLSQTEALFEFNMQRLKEIEDKKGVLDPDYRKLHLRKKEILAFAREHFEKSMAKKGFGQWNGRQIRNAFLIAASLAHYGDGDEGEEGEAGEEELQKQLGRSHFEQVDKTTLLYDQYRREMFNKDDDLRAHEKEER